MTTDRRRLLVLSVVVVAAALAGGVAYATIPDANHVYTACVLKGVGQIRLIDKSLPATSPMSRCTDKETEVSWNQSGPPGAPGRQGDKGEPGNLALAGRSCADGSFVTGFDSNGDLVCAKPGTGGFVADGCGTIPAQGTCLTFVRFVPTGAGIRRAVMTIQGPNGQNVLVPLSGSGL